MIKHRLQWTLGLAACLVALVIVVIFPATRAHLDANRGDTPREPRRDARQTQDQPRLSRQLEVPVAHATDGHAESSARPQRWSDHLLTVESALSRQDMGVAEPAWLAAYMAALRTRDWRPLIEVGDAALRLGAVAGDRASYTARARKIYMQALARARAHGSVEGVLRVATAFRALGDVVVAEQCVLIAKRMGGAQLNEGDIDHGDMNG